MKNHILDIAADLFAQRGYRGATIRDICAFANCSIGTIYDHFSNKMDLYRQAYRRRAHALEPRLLRAARLNSPSLRTQALTSAALVHSEFLRLFVVDDQICAGETDRFLRGLQERAHLPPARMEHVKRALKRAAGMLTVDTVRISERTSGIEPETVAWTSSLFHSRWPDRELQAA
mgnify:CR=1 FL=1